MAQQRAGRAPTEPAAARSSWKQVMGVKAGITLPEASPPALVLRVRSLPVLPQYWLLAQQLPHTAD